jgi:hypothetical protein
MITFLSDIFPKIQRYGEKLDNLTLLTNQNWVSIDNILTNKTVYIFRSNNELIVSTNGKVEKAKWEFLGNKSLLIDKKTDSYLFKHGFFDENILALKVDSREEYAVFVNENKYDGELNSIDGVIEFLRRNYVETTPPQAKSKSIGFFQTNKGELKVELNFDGAQPAMNNKVFQNDAPAKDGKYKLGFMNYLVIKNGTIVDMTAF